MAAGKAAPPTISRQGYAHEKLLMAGIASLMLLAARRCRAPATRPPTATWAGAARLRQPTIWERPELTVPAYLFWVCWRGSGAPQGLAEAEETQDRDHDDDRADDVDNAVHRTSLLGCGTENVTKPQRLRGQRLMQTLMPAHSKPRRAARCGPRWTSRPPRPTNAG